jgi:hypothetical protein
VIFLFKSCSLVNVFLLDLCEYEKIRNRNIRKREALLRRLKIKEQFEELKGLKTRDKPRSKKRKGSQEQQAQKKRRVSKRLRKRTNDGVNIYLYLW